MPRITEASRRRRREQIAAAALRLFERDGFDRTTIADIVEESNLSAGAIYTHFDDKADLVRFVAETKFAEAYPELGRADPIVRTPAEVLELAFGRVRDPSMAPIALQIFAAAARSEELSDLAHERTDAIREILTRLVAPWAERQGDVALEDVAGLLMTLLQGRVVSLSLHPDFDERVIVRAVRAAFG
ncbi:MAG: TetR/AcrR family transcriptional regulator [Microbacterium sp.]